MEGETRNPRVLIALATNSFRASIKAPDSILRSVGHECRKYRLVMVAAILEREIRARYYTCTSFRTGRQRNYDVVGGREFDHTGFCEAGSFSCKSRR